MHQHQCSGRLLALLHRRTLVGVVITTVLTSQTTSMEHSSGNIQARDAIIPGGAEL